VHTNSISIINIYILIPQKTPTPNGPNPISLIAQTETPHDGVFQVQDRETDVTEGRRKEEQKNFRVI
jgi:hypothetical protein